MPFEATLPPGAPRLRSTDIKVKEKRSFSQPSSSVCSKLRAVEGGRGGGSGRGVNWVAYIGARHQKTPYALEHKTQEGLPTQRRNCATPRKVLDVLRRHPVPRQRGRADVGVKAQIGKGLLGAGHVGCVLRLLRRGKPRRARAARRSNNAVGLKRVDDLILLQGEVEAAAVEGVRGVALLAERAGSCGRGRHGHFVFRQLVA